MKLINPNVVKNWYCPNCKLAHQSNAPITEVAHHNCSALNGLFISMVEEGIDCINKINYREDFVGEDICTATHNGKVVSSVTQEHADGSNGLTVFVPCATVGNKAS